MLEVRGLVAGYGATEVLRGIDLDVAPGEIVAVLGLLALFTHIHLFWVAGLLLALIEIPDVWNPLRRMAGALDKIAGIPPERDEDEPPQAATGGGEPPPPIAAAPTASPAAAAPRTAQPEAPAHG